MRAVSSDPQTAYIGRIPLTPGWRRAIRIEPMTLGFTTRALAGVLLAALVTLTPLAYASPPDPTWISGVFDGDDNDDGVFLVTSSTAAVDPFPLCAWHPIVLSWPALVPQDGVVASTPYASTADARASPLS
jgi:hypothetical protein